MTSPSKPPTMPSKPRPTTIPHLVYADCHGEIRDLPELQMAGRSGRDFQAPTLEALIPLPPGSELFVLPGRQPVGIDPASGEPLLLAEDPATGEPVQAVAAFMAPAHTATLWTAYQRQDDHAPPLPLFAYTAVGWHQDRFWVCAWRSDDDRRQEPDRYHSPAIEQQTRRRLRRSPANRLLQHLGKCSLTYGCPAAVNYFMGQWEAPLPTSPTCNARCLGCISLQPSGCCPATQQRLEFVPTAAEIAEVAVEHLAKTGHVASFGQGCEGEPLLQAATLAQAIGLIRRQTNQGRLNCNTNAGHPAAVAELRHAGLDAIRVSLNSAQEHYHQRYYRPLDFTLEQVRESIRLMKAAGGFVSLNYFILPGFTDDPAEFAALSELIAEYRPDFVQLRNLNMDMDWYLDALAFQPTGPPLGMLAWREQLTARFPKLGLGYFNPPGPDYRPPHRRSTKNRRRTSRP
ncbi:MAG: radical SAM protein [Desulfurivibrio sp.]|nr:radical SAM protein [Desulfurivibrio sp.]